jgi:protein ImuB
VDHQRDVVASCCAAAASAGVTPGMTVAHAKALLGSAGPEGVHIQPADPAGAARALTRMARWLLRAVPVVAADEPDGLWLDASGCERLYPDPVRLGRRIVVTLARFGVRARVGIAPTWGAAWALARFGPRRVCAVDECGLRTALDTMPTAALRIEPAAVDALATVGIERVGQLRSLPRRSLADRYGELPLLRLDQALGHAVEVVAPVHPPEPVCVEWLLDGPTPRIEDIELAAQELIGQAAAMLQQRESGCRTMELVLRRSDLPPLTLTVNTSRPTRDPGHLWAMMRPRLETAQLGFGVEGVRVRALGIEPMPHMQAGAWAGAGGAVSGGGSAGAADNVGRLVDTLAARLGRERVLRLCPVQSHLPERMSAYEAIERLDGPDPRREHVALIDADRPSLVLSRPVPVEPTLLVPDGPIAALRSGGTHHRIISTLGPERIGGEWWRDRRPARDYFKVQTERGRWLWVFREVPGARWFLHGEWA